MEKIGKTEYNQLPGIEEEMGETAIFGGAQVFYNIGEVRI
jgi:hypothetical protein